MSKLPLARPRVARLALAAAALIGTAFPASALVAELSLTASDFVGVSGPYRTGEVPPQAEVTASFTVDSDGVRDVPDSVSQGQNGDEPPYEVLSVYTTPTAAQIEIAGYSYPLADLAAYLGFVNGALSQILLSGRFQAEPGSGPPAHVSTASTNDFILHVGLESEAGYEDPRFTYATAETLGHFQAQELRLTLSIDGGEPREFVVHSPVTLPEAIPCFAARSAPGDATLSEDAEPGDVFCEPPDAPPAADATEAASALRDARVDAGAQRSAAAEPVVVTTKLGSLKLAAGAADRVLVAAAAGASPSVEAPETGASYRCAKVRRAPGAARFEPIPEVHVPAANGRGFDAYAVRKPTRLCVDAGSGEALLCYAAKSKGRAARGLRSTELWVAHELGKERLKVSRGAQLCLPAETAAE